MLLALMATLLASPAVGASSPVAAPAIIGVKASGHDEVVRVAFLGFDGGTTPRSPAVLNGVLHSAGRTTQVTLHVKWRGFAGKSDGWAVADYAMQVPPGATGAAVLSLDATDQGWYFRLGE